MIRLFICPCCGWIRTVSRRSNVECLKCQSTGMEPVKLDYKKYTQMSVQERQDYVDSWMYIHKTK